MRVQLENRLDRIIIAWLFLAGLACAARVAFTPVMEPLGLGLSCPICCLFSLPLYPSALRCAGSPTATSGSAAEFACARLGKWRTVDRSEARRHSLYGAGGIMVSLLVGMLINVPFRAIEYLGAMPAVSGQLPAWLSVLHMMMTLDVVIMTSLYSIAFVAALRHVPLFPRLLVAIWTLDLAMQLMTAELVAGAPGSAAGGCWCAARPSRRQREEGPDQRRFVAAVPASLAAGERDLPEPRCSLSPSRA